METLDTKDAFIRRLSAKTNYTLKDTEAFVDALVQVFEELIIENLDAPKEVTKTGKYKSLKVLSVKGLGKLVVQTLRERDGFKPIPGKVGEGTRMHYGEAHRIMFKLSSNIRNLGKDWELVDENDLEELEEV
jgi:hypothetical protein